MRRERLQAGNVRRRFGGRLDVAAHQDHAPGGKLGDKRVRLRVGLPPEEQHLTDFLMQCHGILSACGLFAGHVGTRGFQLVGNIALGSQRTDFFVGNFAL